MKCQRNGFNQNNNSSPYGKRANPIGDKMKTNGVNLARIQDDSIRHVQNQRSQLPIYAVRNRLLEEIDHNPRVIILGETGSGKTTQIPQYLYEDKNYSYGMIGITQPRRIAAITVAKRVATEMNVTIGTTVGYCVRFEDVTSPSTKLKYMTDGMLLRESLIDSLLNKYSVIILDEAHERTVHTDILFGIVKNAQAERRRLSRRPLKILVMSATMDVDSFSAYFNNAPVLYVEGRQFPVQIMYTKENQSDYLFSCLVAVFQIHQEKPLPGDILLFLTGQDEINSAVKFLRDVSRTLPSDVPPIQVLPLYASLPSVQQLAPFQPVAQGLRRVIVSTNIAETSITLTGVRYVIDSGFVKMRFYSPITGLDLLKIQRISKAQAWQRAGRAGREAEGICYRIYSETSFSTFPDNPSPEIQRCCLSNVVLQLLVLGVENVYNFDFMDKPPAESISNAMDQLILLKAVDKNGVYVTLTDLGRDMSMFPVDPTLSKIIFASKEFGCTDEVVTIISLLSVDSVMYDPPFKKEEAAAARRKFFSDEGDLIFLLKIFQALKNVSNVKHWCQEHFLNLRNLKMADDIRKQLVDLCIYSGIECKSCGSDFTPVRRCFAQGLFMNSAELRPSQEYVTILKRQVVHIHPSSCLFNATKPSHVLYTELVQTTKTYMRSLCVVEPEWLYEACPGYFRNKISSAVFWNKYPSFRRTNK